MTSNRFLFERKEGEEKSSSRLDSAGQRVNLFFRERKDVEDEGFSSGIAFKGITKTFEGLKVLKDSGKLSAL